MILEFYYKYKHKTLPAYFQNWQITKTRNMHNHFTLVSIRFSFANLKTKNEKGIRYPFFVRKFENEKRKRNSFFLFRTQI